MAGNCPNPQCERRISNTVAESADVVVGFNRFRGLIYLCPGCRTVLGAGIDPFALKADIVKEIKGR